MKIKKIFSLLIIFIIPSIQLNLFAQQTHSLKTIDPKIVLERYLDAIGGRDALSKVEDRTTIMRGTAMGQSLTIIVKQKAPNKMRQEVKAGGMDQTIIFDGEKGVMKAATQNVDVTGKELEQLKIEATMELLLDIESNGVKLDFEGTEKINSKDAHKIKMTLPSGIRWFTYFDAESGLKIKEQKEMQTQMGLIEQVVVYDNYTEVDGIKYPFKLTQSFGPQSVEMTVSSVKVNTGVNSSIFEIVEGPTILSQDNSKQLLVNDKDKNDKQKSILPPNLSLAVSFSDENNDNFMEGNEKGIITLKITNRGRGTALGLSFDISDQSKDVNLSYLKSVKAGDIPPGIEKIINIDVFAGKNIQKNKHYIIIKSIEKNGFNPPDIKISFESIPLLLPDIILADYGIISNRGDNIIRAGEISNIKLRIQNIGQGRARNVNFLLELPENIFITPDSKSSQYFKAINPGDYADIDISIIPNNNVEDKIQLNFKIKDDNTELNLPLDLPINKQLASIQELIVKGREIEIPIKDATKLSSDVEKNIPISSSKNNNAVALVIGISDYQNGNVPKVTYAKRDASLIRQYLENTFGYDSKNILPRNEDELMTSGTIKNYIKNVIPSYLKKDGSSELFIYFTGHGAPSTKTRSAYFVPYDCDPNYVSDINAYKMSEFYSDIAKLKAQKKIVVIDACFSGQSGDGSMLITNASPAYITVENEANLDDKSMMFLSSGPDQVSNWYPEEKHSMFTYFFLKGLQGNADLNKDSTISAQELVNYINDENNGLPYYSNREFQRPQRALFYGSDLVILKK